MKANELNPFHGIQRIVSGGQTGVDRAALDVAIELGIEHGGWCPRGRLSEDGPIASKYELTEMDSKDYAKRTEQNVIDSDGTLIIYQQRLQGGTLLTQKLAKRHEKPYFRIRIDAKTDVGRFLDWLDANAIRVLNVAGPRASSHPGIAAQSSDILRRLLLATPRFPE